MDVRFSLLGSVRVESAEGPREIRGPLRRTLLAALALHAGSVLSGERLAELLWGTRRPASATTPLHNQVARLRQAIGPAGERIRAVPPGYLLRVEPGELDVHVFEEHCEDGRRAGAGHRWADAEQAFTAALRLWRGEPLADVPALAEHPAVQRLTEARMRAVLGRVEARLNLGRHEEVTGELFELAAAHPLREDLHARLMLALYRSGRQAEALDAYRLLRRAVVAELGVEPSAEIRRLHTRILNSDRELATVTPPRTQAAAPEPPARRPAPAGDRAYRNQLPPDTRLFTGRDQEVAELLEVAGSAPYGNAAGMVVISALNGMGGVGKTALAVHVAHRMSARFPDGQLFVELRGHTPGLEPLTAQQALHHLLRSLGVEPGRIPEDLAECAAFYRSRLVGTRTLIVLDDASGAAQVRPLLPAEPGCLVLVTSRAVLGGLEDAHGLDVDVLRKPDALALLAKVAGRTWAGDERAAASELVSLCGNMPLALRIAGARLRHGRTTGVGELVAQLRADGGGLRLLSDADRSMEALFDTSYAHLYDVEQRMFRLLGLVPGPDVDVAAAARLADVDPRTAERLLESLLDHHLLIQGAPGRYRMHDLLRAYARALTERAGPGAETADADGAAAFERLLAHYADTAASADLRITWRSRSDRPAAGPVTDADSAFPDEDRANAWFAVELPNLLAALESDGLAPRPRIALTIALATYVFRQGLWAAALRLHRAAAEAAREIGDGRAEGEILWEQSQVLGSMGEVSAARTAWERSLGLFRDLGDRQGEANALACAGSLFGEAGDAVAAVEHEQRALEIYREIGDRRGMASSLWNLSRFSRTSQGPEAAAALMAQARELFAEFGYAQGLAAIEGELGRLRLGQGRYREAVGHSSRAASIFRERGGHRQSELAALLDLSRARLGLGEFAVAERLRLQAEQACLDLGFPHGDAIVLFVRGEILRATGDQPGALEAQLAALAIFEKIGDAYGQTFINYEIGRSRHALGELAAAQELLEGALAGFREFGDTASEAETHSRLGALATDQSRPEAAMDHFRRALAILRDTDNPSALAHTLEGASRCLEATDRAGAIAHLAEAVELYRRMEAWEAGRAAQRLAELTAAG